MGVRKRVFIALFLTVLLSSLFLNGLSPLSSLYFSNTLPNYLTPATTPYNLALIELNNYIPPNASVATPATAVPWYSLTRYGWGSHGVPFFGPNSQTQYVVYSPLVPTGYPYNPGLGYYEPYIFNDGAWLLARDYDGSVIKLHGFNYTTTITLQPITPGTHQYIIALLPNGQATIRINIKYTPLKTIKYITNELPWITQQPQGIACGPTPNYFVELNPGWYVVQPITLNKTETMETLVIFGSESTNLVSGKIMLSRTPAPIQTEILWSGSFSMPWWCEPHSWATPITLNPEITLKPGTYYIIAEAPTQWQVLCTYILNAPKAMIFNGNELQQLNCTLNTIIVTNKPTQETNVNTTITINILGDTATINTQKPTNLTLNYETNLTNPTNWETLIISTNQPVPGRLTVTISTYVPGQEPPIAVPWYLTPAYGYAPTYALLTLTIIALTKEEVVTRDSRTS